MKDDFEAIKNQVDITNEITRRTGGTVKKVGKAYDLSQCPFCSGHDCFRIYPDTRSWNCHQCGDKTGGSIIDFVIKEKGCSPHEALVDLAQAHNYELWNHGPDHDGDQDENSTGKLIFEAAANYYAKVLYSTPRALEYQRKVQSHSDQTLKEFRVGHTDGKLLAELQKQNFSMEDILNSGLVVPYKKGGYHDFFGWNVYIYPHKDKAGKIYHFSVKDPRKKYNYQLPSKHRLNDALFFNMKAFNGNQVVLVEGENDLLSVYGKGNFTQAAAVIGQISDKQIQYLKEWVKKGQAKPYFKPLSKIIRMVKAMFQEAKINNCTNEIGEVVFDYFNRLGGFFVNGENCRLFYENAIYELGNNIAFKSLLYRTASLNYADNGTKSILEVLRAKAYQDGKHTTTMGWIHTNEIEEIIYYDLNNEQNNIARIHAGSIELIQNGANDDRVLLETTPRMEPIHYLPDANIQEGMEKYKETILDNLACNESNKYYIAARVMNTPLLEFVTTARGITKLSGDQGAAKSFAARLNSYLIMGSDCVSMGSVASYRSEAVKSPVVIPDNLEKADRTKDMVNFLLVSATGAMNQKRDSNTNSGNVYEENKTQVITTSIEPFTESELISRTIDIHFKREFQNKEFPGETLLKTEIKKNRDLIWKFYSLNVPS
ncbi:CHC2 zinc finger domain-containing protein [Desulfobacula toluolica]|uniref:DnaG: DNA primase n=1 Tax=Desulfobacula toluolica (strain DSM 7467 / Tol2) TaxID=651182 RepID=K0N5V9_DESTT|nr:CHC2 zinc finger domain-containing protein [Desulfobacula toluolica]CCK79429.1 DnaG: DNA primase [Desulfobacula toluolica Tol2]